MTPGREADGVATRRLQQVGGGTYTVSIPKGWADDRRLEAGMELHLYAHDDGSIVLRDAATDGGHLATARIAVSGDDPALVERTLRCAHAAGFGTVTLVPGDGTSVADAEATDGGTADGGTACAAAGAEAGANAGAEADPGADADPGAEADPGADADVGNPPGTSAERGFTDEQRRAARAVTRTLVGADLVTADPAEIAVDHVLDASNVSVRQTVLQLQFTALAVFEGATTAAVDGDAGAVDRLGERRAEAARLRRLVERHAVRAQVSFAEIDRLGVSRPELLDCYVAARALERVASEGLRIARVADEPGPAPDAVAPTVREAAALAAGVVEAATTALLDGQRPAATAHDALDDGEAVRRTVESAEGALSEAAVETSAAAGTARLLDAVGRVADAGETVALAALRSATRARDRDRSGAGSQTGGDRD